LLREEPRQPARGREGGDPCQREEQAVWALLLDGSRRQGVRQVGERARRVWLVRRPRRREDRRRREVLRDLLRAEQRRPRDRRRRDAGGGLREGREVLRADPVAED